VRRADELVVDVALLQQSQLFSALDDAALRELLPLVEAQKYHAGMLISETQGFSHSVFVVAHGRVRSFHLSTTGGMVTLCILQKKELFVAPRTIRPGSSLHTSSTKAPYRLAAHFQAITATEVYRIPRQQVQQLVSSDPRAADAWLELQDGWLGDLYRRLEELALLDVPSRLAHALVRLCAANDKQCIPETHQELAWLVGANRETVTRELNRFRHMGLIEYERHVNGIRVLDLENLNLI
jgi:CRP/FNR family transcriptional regulator